MSGGCLETEAFHQFIRSKEPVWLADEEIRSLLRGLIPRVPFPPDRDRSHYVLGNLAEEAAHTIELIDGYYSPSDRLLEVGGGIGLVYAWLKHEGIDITSLEPALVGHEPYFQLGRRLAEALGLDSSNWLPLEASAAGKLGKKFDLIFSLNVLEHIQNLDESIRILAERLSEKGRMRHSCPNYTVPYEPHFGFPLIPFAPRATARIFDVSSEPELWEGVNFLTSFRVRRLARQAGLATRFDRGVLHAVFCRFDRDPAFSTRHPVLHSAYRVLKTTGLLSALRLAPPTLVTPMSFTLHKGNP